MEYFSNNLVYLRNKAGKTQQEVNFALGFKSPGRYGNYETKHSKPDVDALVELSKYFMVSIDDLLNKDLSVPPPLGTRVSEPVADYGTKLKAIPLIPIGAVAGFGEGESQVSYLDTEKYVIPEFNKKADFLIRISGTSMSPKYFNGDVVACKKISLNTFIQWGKVYVMDTEQGVLCKRLYAGTGAKTFKVVSDNKETYPEFEMNVDEVRSLAIVVGVIRLE